MTLMRLFIYFHLMVYVTHNLINFNIYSDHLIAQIYETLQKNFYLKMDSYSPWILIPIHDHHQGACVSVQMK